MTTYLTKTNKALTRQEGDNASIVFIVPDILPLTGRTATFKAVDSRNRTTLSKTFGSGLSISGQQISITLLPDDTKGHAGSHRWELELSTPQVITIARGSLTIIPEIIK